MSPPTPRAASGPSPARGARGARLPRHAAEIASTRRLLKTRREHPEGGSQVRAFLRIQHREERRDERRPQRGSRRALRRLVAGAALLGGVLGATVPARAGYVVCATVYYRAFGGPKQYVLNNQCYVPGSWAPLTGLGPDCTLDPSIVQVCHTITVSGPS